MTLLVPVLGTEFTIGVSGGGTAINGNAITGKHLVVEKLYTMLAFTENGCEHVLTDAIVHPPHGLYQGVKNVSFTVDYGGMIY